MSMEHYDVIVIGAGAGGLFCAIHAGKRGRRVLVLDHAHKTAEKIRISGGGRCNFTNIHTSPAHFLSENPHFCKSALSRYTPQDFIALLKKHDMAWHEKKLGQLFCDNSAQDVIDMLLTEARAAGMRLEMGTSVETIASGYHLRTTRGAFSCDSLVIATGGLSIPKIGASKFGYDVARQFGLRVVQTRPALVPLTFSDAFLARCQALSGLSVEAQVSAGKKSFAEGLLFTHRGLSGPSILQISSYWREGEEIVVNLAQGHDVFAVLKGKKTTHPKQEIQTALSEFLPKRLADDLCAALKIAGRLADQSDKTLQGLGLAVNGWRIKPSGTEGYRTAEVTLGGVDTRDLSSKTMEAVNVKGLYFIGEVVDVTGHLGGFNFQWAWSSGYVAGLNV